MPVYTALYHFLKNLLALTYLCIHISQRAHGGRWPSESVPSFYHGGSEDWIKAVEFDSRCRPDGTSSEPNFIIFGAVWLVFFCHNHHLWVRQRVSLFHLVFLFLLMPRVLVKKAGTQNWTELQPKPAPLTPLPLPFSEMALLACNPSCLRRPHDCVARVNKTS